jgi:hypothetical protein
MYGQYAEDHVCRLEVEEVVGREDKAQHDGLGTTEVVAGIPTATGKPATRK